MNPAWAISAWEFLVKFRSEALAIGLCLTTFGWSKSCGTAREAEGRLAECEVRRAELTLALSPAQSVTASGKAETRVVIRYKEVSGTAQPCPDIDLTAFTLGSVGASQAQAVTVTPAKCPDLAPVRLYSLWIGGGYMEGAYGALGGSYGPWLAEISVKNGPSYGGGLRYKAFSW